MPDIESKTPEKAGSAPTRLIDEVVTETTRLLAADGEMPRGKGLRTTAIALGLAFLGFLAVLAFHFPQYLTTPELRHEYSVQLCRYILFASLLVSGCLSLGNIILDRMRGPNIAAFVFVLAAVALGGSKVPVGAFPDHTPYLGLDWLILDLLGSTTVFVLLEKLFPLNRAQVVFRKEWQTDLTHFGVNHLLVGLLLLVVNFFIHRLLAWAGPAPFQQMVENIPYLPQVLLCVLVADLMEYTTHRAYHEVPWLWKFHAVHHSVKTLDWLAGSRLHLLEITATRVAVLAPLFLLGFEKSVIDTYIIIVGFQAVFIHANIHMSWGPLKYLIVTPNFHHWHHSSEEEAIDRNYAAHFAFLDYLFGTAVKTQREFPKEYGVVGDYMPEGYLKQQAFPFRKYSNK
jgi:sterol desaturase/sphingolipid hydroxylase (fatty acid hydroxylase superfamily)